MSLSALHFVGDRFVAEDGEILLRASFMGSSRLSPFCWLAELPTSLRQNVSPSICHVDTAFRGRRRRNRAPRLVHGGDLLVFLLLAPRTPHVTSPKRFPVRLPCRHCVSGQKTEKSGPASSTWGRFAFLPFCLPPELAAPLRQKIPAKPVRAMSPSEMKKEGSSPGGLFRWLGRTK